jgi:hypothetical protein
VNAADFLCFISTGTGWGVFSQKRAAADYQATLRLHWGELTLRCLRLEPMGQAAVSLDGAPVSAQSRGTELIFKAPIRIAAGQLLSIQVLRERT